MPRSESPPFEVSHHTNILSAQLRIGKLVDLVHWLSGRDINKLGSLGELFADGIITPADRGADGGL